MPLRETSWPPGATIALYPVVEATTTARSNSTALILAMASCWPLSAVVGPSRSKVASLLCMDSRLAPAATSERTRSSKPTS